jgi:hypothetical protein
MTMTRSLLLCPILLLTGVLALTVSAHGAEPRLSPILIPTLYNGPGGFGSYWWTTVVVNNHAPRPFSSPGVQFRVLVACSIPEGCPSAAVPPGEFADVNAPQAPYGLLLYAPEDIARDLAFQARFGSGFDDIGTSSELPLVREAEFTPGPVRLPSVALHGTPTDIRSTLRIYAPDAQPGTSVRVEVRRWDQPTAPVAVQRTVHLFVPASPPSSDLPLYPAYAQLALQQEFPIEVAGGTTVNMTIVPLPLISGEIPRIWAFISTTENATQEVVIQRPQ